MRALIWQGPDRYRHIRPYKGREPAEFAARLGALRYAAKSWPFLLLTGRSLMAIARRAIMRSWRSVFIEKHRSAISTLRILLLIAMHATLPHAGAQSQFTRIYGPEDQDVPVPQFMPSTGIKDKAALQAIQAFVAAVSGGNWTGIQGTGTLTTPNGNATNQSQATLTMQNDNALRLDVSASSGAWSIRMYGSNGGILEGNGSTVLLPAVTANCGLFAFSKLLATTFATSPATVVDRGTLTIDGQLLHRITIELSDNASESSLPSGDISVIDLYFDPVTSFLLKSAVSVQLDSRSRANYLQVMTYSDYQIVSGVLVPFSYRQTLNGQRQWTLLLTSAKPESSLEPSYFQF